MTARDDRRAHWLLPGLGTGLVAALAMTLATWLLRLLAGVPLPVELASDRIVPTLSYQRFGHLVHVLGGPQLGKERSYWGSLVLQIVIGTLGGALYALLVARAARRATATRRPWWRSPVAVLRSVLVAIWVAALAALWPVLASNYRGLPPGPAAVAGAGGLAVSFALYLVVLVTAHRASRVGSATAPIRPAAGTPAGRRFDRRTVLLGGTGVAMAAATAGTAWTLLDRATVGPNGYDGLLTKGQHLPPITPNDRFYVVTKNVIDPNIVRGLWRLQVTGLVDRPHTYDFDELAGLTAVDQVQTLECISNRVGGRLMSNAAWRGVPLATLLAVARPKAGVRTVALHASDGYTHALAFDKAMEPTTLVAYEMNGEPLPHRHGYPARVLVPGGYGELSVKWVDRVDLLDESFEGYYERQGWRPGVVHTTARFDTPFGRERFSLARTPTIPLAGVAFSGDRGISKVEVSTDGGAAWQEVTIGYAPSPMAWAMWSGSWTPPGPGSYTLSVRATDGHGALQSPVRMGSAPSGASGYQRIPVTVEP